MRRMLATAVSTATLVAGMLGMPIASADTGGPADPPASMTLFASTTLTTDHVGNIVIARDDVTLDCAGHAVIGPAFDARSGGIEIAGVSRVTVRNCVITGFEAQNGIFAYGSEIRLEHNTVFGNANHGIALDSGSDAIIEHNTVRDNGVNGPSVGIILSRSVSATIRSNTVSGQEWAGIALVQATTGSTIARNTVTGNYSGILVADESNDNVVRANTASRNTHGISILAARRNVVDGNTANSNESGAFSADRGSSSNTFSNNTANRNNDGFDLRNGATSNVVTGNTANRNRHIGFLVWYGSGSNILTNNTAHKNDLVDASDEGTGTGNTWYGNRFGTTSGL